MVETARQRARWLAREFMGRGEPLGWFEPLYTAAEGDAMRIQWADLLPNPHLVEWLDHGLRCQRIDLGQADDAVRAEAYPLIRLASADAGSSEQRRLLT